MRFWCKLPEAGDNVETCRSEIIERICRLQKSAFLGVTTVLIMHGKNNVKVTVMNPNDIPDPPRFARCPLNHRCSSYGLTRYNEQYRQ
jgi:hypothetical protein